VEFETHGLIPRAERPTHQSCNADSPANPPTRSSVSGLNVRLTSPATAGSRGKRERRSCRSGLSVRLTSPATCLVLVLGYAGSKVRPQRPTHQSCNAQPREDQPRTGRGPASASDSPVLQPVPRANSYIPAPTRPVPRVVTTSAPGDRPDRAQSHGASPGAPGTTATRAVRGARCITVALAGAAQQGVEILKHQPGIHAVVIASPACQTKPVRRTTRRECRPDRIVEPTSTAEGTDEPFNPVSRDGYSEKYRPRHHHPRSRHRLP
jgi:hypothetical protein